MSIDSQQVYDSWQFVGQALQDFARTLPPSASEAFREVVGRHHRVLGDALQAACTPPETEAVGEEGQERSSAADPA